MSCETGASRPVRRHPIVNPEVLSHAGDSQVIHGTRFCTSGATATFATNTLNWNACTNTSGGNGWNYEDGTLARDALNERLVAARNGGSAVKVVANVPFGVAMLGSITSTISISISDVYSSLKSG